MIRESLSKLSFDHNKKISVCDYDNKFINLDNSKGVLSKTQPPKTSDMVYINDEKKEIWFVEFKSSKESNLKFKELYRKLFASLFLLYEIYCKKSCSYRDYDKFYFVVYNKEYSSSEDEVLEFFENDSERSIEFKLEELKPHFVKDIFTESCEKLKELFLKRFDIKFVKENNG